MDSLGHSDVSNGSSDGSELDDDRDPEWTLSDILSPELPNTNFEEVYLHFNNVQHFLYY